MQTRTFCYVEDNVKACINAFYKNLYLNDVVNIGGENEITILDLAKTIIEITNSKSKIIFMPPLKEGDMRGRHPDTTKMKPLIDSPLLPLKEGLKRILEQGLFELINI